MLDLIGPLIFGLAGSLHCLGMCGPLVLAYSLHLRPPGAHTRDALWPASARHHLAFHTGRLLTYGLLGALAAGITGIVDFHRFFAGLRGAVTLGGGALMVLFGLGLLSVVPVGLGRLRFPATGPLAAIFPVRLFSSKGVASKLLLGVAAGCLPCMLSFAMIVKAATTGRAILGFLTMVLFGLGTVPVLFFTGFSASLFSLRARLLGERVAAGTVIVMGLILIGKYLSSCCR
ncbi:MAG: sulfite exporter TauE/SafE family protein [Syntrophorhabdales bacterium]|jgi:sulfite exporter TauE/SafE